MILKNLENFEKPFYTEGYLETANRPMPIQAHTHTPGLFHVFLSVVFRVRPLSDGNNPWSTSLVKSQKSVPLAALFAEQGELKIHRDAVIFNYYY